MIQKIKQPNVTLYLVIVNILVLAVCYLGKLYNVDIKSVIAIYPLSSKEFHYWQIITHMFCHANTIHLMFNMMCIMTIGVVVESLIGKWKYLLVYFIGGIVAIVMQYAFNEYIGIYKTAMGASGCAMALVACFAVLLPDEKLSVLFLPSVKAKYIVPVVLSIELALGVINFDVDPIGHFAHIGGAIMGYSIAFYIKKQNR